MPGASFLLRLFGSKRVLIVVFALLALAPILFVAAYSATATRNIAYWDEFDTVLDLLLDLDSGVDLRGFLGSIFEISNEHRMVTSRLMFAASWWLTGTVDFRIFSVIGNLFLVGLCAVLVWSAGTTERRVRLGLVLAFVMFQLEHYENLLWSGSSIDHFQVVALAVGALVALAHGTRPALGVASVLGVLATFTLAHGLVVWPVGALLLARDRRWRAFAGWIALALAAGGAFFLGFRFNLGHQFLTLSFAGVAHLLGYWLSLLGAPLALGYAGIAPAAGVLLLAGLGWLGVRGGWHRERVALPVALFCVGALALVALGRSEVGGGLLHSRYLVLGALAWALLCFCAIEQWSEAESPYRRLVWCLPALVGFNLAANVRFLPAAELWVEGRDRAALRFKAYNEDGHGPFRLHPNPTRSSTILSQTALHGIYELPRLCLPKQFPEAKPSGRIVYFVDEMTANTAGVYVAGWAAIPELTSRRGQIHVVLQSDKSLLVFSTVGMRRSDVVQATGQSGWQLAGFRFAVKRTRLPREDFRVGLLLTEGDEAEYIMTEHWLKLRGPGEAVLATGP